MSIPRFQDTEMKAIGAGLDLPGQVAGWVHSHWANCVQTGHRLVTTVADKERLSKQMNRLRSTAAVKKLQLDRTAQFWARSIQIYAGYKVCQVRVKRIKDPAERLRVWEAQHEDAADRLYRMCVDLGGFFLKAGQFLAKPDLVPMAWVRRLSVLQDGAPTDPFPVVRSTLEAELGGSLETFFEYLEEKPIGSASIAQVHRGRLKKDKRDVAVKVQHVGIEPLMMMDLANYKHFGGFLQKFELAFDVLSVLDELEAQVKHEFDFRLEARNMDSIGESLARGGRGRKGAKDAGKAPIIVPRSIPGMVTRRMLVMDFIKGVQITRMGEEMKRRGMNPDGRLAKIGKKNILRDLTEAYGHMILRDGHFQADPHPGNILVCEGAKVALLDYGQTKKLSDDLRLKFAELVLAVAAENVSEIGRLFNEIGIKTEKTAQQAPRSFRRMGILMFDTKTTSTITTSNPFSEESTLKDNGVQTFPKDLFFVLRTMQLLRGLSAGMGVNYSAAQQWTPIAQEVLAAAKSR